MKPRIKHVTILMSMCIVLASAAFAGTNKECAKSADDELRMKNQATVEKYFAVSFIQGVDLFTDDGSNGGQVGKAALMQDAEFNTRSFPDWKYTKLKVYSTQDPNLFFVVASGSGTVYKNGDPKATPGHYSNEYINVLIMQDGKIKSFQENMLHEMNLLKAFGISVPEAPAPDYNAYKASDKQK
jgi:hypothetical protein